MLIGFWHEWGSTIEWASAAIGGWWAKAAANRLQAQRNTIDASQADTERMRLSLERERSLTERVLAYASETRDIWSLTLSRPAMARYHVSYEQVRAARLVRLRR